MKLIDKDILKLAIPSILANITVPIVGIVDMAVAGHWEGTAKTMMGGITIGTVLFDLLYWNFFFLRIGTGGLTAQAVGRKDHKECANVFSRAFGIAMLLALGILLIQWLFIDVAFYLFPCEPDVQALASEYFFIRIWAAPATMTLMSFKGWFIGMQDTVSSMLTDLVVNVTNILMSIVLALGFQLGNWHYEGMGFAGIAVGTVIAQYSGLATAFLLLFVKYRKRIFTGYRWHDFLASFKGGEMKKFFVVNTNLFVRSICFILIYMGFTMISTHYGTLLMDVGAIMMKLLMIFSYFTDGFSYAGEALSGKYVGAQDKPMFQTTVRHTFAWSMAVAAFFVVIYWVFGVPMLRLITPEAEVVSAARPYLWWLLLMPVFGCAAFTWDGIYIGATESRSIRQAAIWSTVGLFVFYFAGRGIMEMIGQEGIAAVGLDWYGLALHLLLGGYFMHLLVRTVYLSATYKKQVLRKYFKEG